MHSAQPPCKRHPSTLPSKLLPRVAQTSGKLCSKLSGGGSRSLLAGQVKRAMQAIEPATRCELLGWSRQQLDARLRRALMTAAARTFWTLGCQLEPQLRRLRSRQRRTPHTGAHSSRRTHRPGGAQVDQCDLAGSTAVSLKRQLLVSWHEPQTLQDKSCLAWCSGSLQ